MPFTSTPHLWHQDDFECEPAAEHVDRQYERARAGDGHGQRRVPGDVVGRQRAAGDGDFTTAAGTLPTNDFVATSGTLTFAAGITTEFVTVAVRADSSLTQSATSRSNCRAQWEPSCWSTRRPRRSSPIPVRPWSRRWPVRCRRPARRRRSVRRYYPGPGGSGNLRLNGQQWHAGPRGLVCQPRRSRAEQTDATDLALASDETWALAGS